MKYTLKLTEKQVTITLKLDDLVQIAVPRHANVWPRSGLAPRQNRGPVVAGEGVNSTYSVRYDDALLPGRDVHDLDMTAIVQGDGVRRHNADVVYESAAEAPNRRFGILGWRWLRLQIERHARRRPLAHF